jgi:hypothetical protein
MKDENELQQKVESGHFDSGRDSDAYAKVFRILSGEKPKMLSPAFAELVVKRIVQKQKRNRFVEEYLLVTVAFIAIAAAGGYCIATTDFKFNLGFLTALSDYVGVLSFGAAFIILLNLFDLKLLRKTHKKSSH